MATIKSVKLIGSGDKGIEIIREELQKKEEVTVRDDVKRTRSIPIPLSLKESMASLKYHYLKLLRMFPIEWEQYINDCKVTDKNNSEANYTRCVELFECTEIVGLKKTGTGWSVMGVVEMCTGEEQSLSTVGVEEGGDYENSGKMYEQLRIVMKEVRAYFDNDKMIMMPGSQYVLKFGKEGEQVENSDEFMMNSLVDKGYLILEPDVTGIEKAVDSDIEEVVEDIVLPVTDAVAGSQEAVEEFSKTELGKKLEKVKINKSKKEETVNVGTEEQW